jgi:GDSL-like lipase/acylhydrolase family protein
MHLFMIGDSVFDNRAYVAPGEPDLRQQVANILGQQGRVSSAAIDGAVIPGIVRQLIDLPADATHIVVSAGGNDALQSSDVLNLHVKSVTGALDKVSGVCKLFELDYIRLLDQLARTRLPAAVCTIYDPRFPDPLQRRTGRTALSVLNDVITRQAFGRGLALIDLRLVCNEDNDFANAIEPSAKGGEKIALAIARFANGGAGSSAVFI